ncbi:MAG: hypothetical protein AMXMBFR64_05220 [Myxococcales bacterium]
MHGRVTQGPRTDTGRVREALTRRDAGEPLSDVARDWGVSLSRVGQQIRGWRLASDGRAVRAARPPADYELTVSALVAHRAGATWAEVAEHLDTTVRRLKRLAERWALGRDGELLHRKSSAAALQGAPPRRRS